MQTEPVEMIGGGRWADDLEVFADDKGKEEITGRENNTPSSEPHEVLAPFVFKKTKKIVSLKRDQISQYSCSQLLEFIKKNRPVDTYALLEAIRIKAQFPNDLDILLDACIFVEQVGASFIWGRKPFDFIGQSLFQSKDNASQLTNLHKCIDIIKKLAQQRCRIGVTKLCGFLATQIAMLFTVDKEILIHLVKEILNLSLTLKERHFEVVLSAIANNYLLMLARYYKQEPLKNNLVTLDYMQLVEQNFGFSEGLCHFALLSWTHLENFYVPNFPHEAILQKIMLLLRENILTFQESQYMDMKEYLKFYLRIEHLLSQVKLVKGHQYIFSKDHNLAVITLCSRLGIAKISTLEPDLLLQLIIRLRMIDYEEKVALDGELQNLLNNVIALDKRKATDVKKLFTWDDFKQIGGAYPSYGKSFTNIRRGQLYEYIAEDIIARNYSDLTTLSYIFSVTSHTSSEGDTTYNKAPPSNFNLSQAYTALQNNTTISVIRYDHFKHIADSLEKLFQALAHNHQLPLDELTLNSIVPKYTNAMIAQTKRHTGVTMDPDIGMSATLSKYLGDVIRLHTGLRTLSFSSNRLGLCESIDEDIEKFAPAIGASHSLQTVDLSNNKFTFSQALRILDLLEPNSSITSLKLGCRTMHRSEKKDLNKLVEAFLSKNLQLRDRLFQAIRNGDIQSINEQLQNNVCLFYTNNNMTILTYIDHLSQNLPFANIRLERRLASIFRRRNLDSERNAMILQNNIVIQNLPIIKGILLERLSALNNNKTINSADMLEVVNVNAQ